MRFECVSDPLRKLPIAPDESMPGNRNFKTLVEMTGKNFTLASKNGFVMKAERFAVSVNVYSERRRYSFLQISKPLQRGRQYFHRTAIAAAKPVTTAAHGTVNLANMRLVRSLERAKEGESF